MSSVSRQVPPLMELLSMESSLVTANGKDGRRVNGPKAWLGVQMAGRHGKMTPPECDAFLSMRAASVVAATLLYKKKTIGIWGQ